MKTFIVTINERSGEFEYMDVWLVDAHDQEEAEKEVHQIMMNYRGEAEFEPSLYIKRDEKGNPQYEKGDGQYDYGEHMSYVNSMCEVPQEDVHTLRKYIMTLSPDEHGITLAMALQHKQGETLSLSDWDQVFNPIPNHIDVSEQYFETVGEELEFVRQQDPNKVWTVVEEGNRLYLHQGYHLVNRLKYVVTEEACPEELMGCSVVWCEFDGEDDHE